MPNNAIRQEKERTLWDKLAAGYDRSNLKTFKAAYAESVLRTGALSSETHEVLEIGCGTGIIALGIARRVKRVVGVDISPNMIAIAQAKAAQQAIHNVSFQTADGYSLPFEDETFDQVLLFNVLHIVKEPDTLLKEACRLLKPGGCIVSATDCLAEPVSLLAYLTLAVEWLLHKLGNIPFLNLYKKDDLQKKFEQHELTIVETYTLHPAPLNYFILARK